jgi:hypothetical protein
MPCVLVRTAACCALMVLLVAAASASRGDTRTGAGQNVQAQNPDAPIIADFQARVKEYADLHEKLESTLPSLPKETTPQRIAEHQQGLERLIARERSRARRGDIFTTPIRAYFRRQLSRVFNGPEGRAVRAEIMDEETRAVRLRINGRYPEGVPRSSMPPQVLLVLPRLPEQLEYRFVGDRLVLLDIHALTVVDFMDSAVPR